MRRPQAAGPAVRINALLGITSFLHRGRCRCGGCLLTDPIFAARLRDLLEHDGEFRKEELAVAASITSRYGKSGGRSATTVLCRRVGDGAMVSIRVGPVDRESVRSKTIGTNSQADE